MKRLFLLLAACAVALAQSPVNVSIGPPPTCFSQAIAYSGADVEYVGLAPCLVPQYRVTVTTATNANPVVITSAAHGLQTDNAVTISGFTGNWSPVNGTNKITVVNVNSFSIAVDSSGFGAFGAQAPTAVATAPRTNATIWSIQKFYSTAGAVVRAAWADGTQSNSKAWDSKATYSYQ